MDDLSKSMEQSQSTEQINKSLEEQIAQTHQKIQQILHSMLQTLAKMQEEDDTDEDEDLTLIDDCAGEAYFDDDDPEHDFNDSDPAPADSKSTSELGKGATMEEQFKFVNHKSDVVVYEVQNDAPELFDESHKKGKLQVTTIEPGEGAVDALGEPLVESGCDSDAIKVPGPTIPPEPPDTLHIIASITEYILNLPTYPNSFQFNPAYSVIKQYFVDVDDIVPQKVVVHKDLIQDGVLDELLALDLGKQVHTCVISNKVEFDYMLGSALRNMYGKCSDIDGVKYAYCLLNVGGSIIVNKFLNGDVGPKTIHIPITFDPGGIQRNGIAVQLGCGAVEINDFASNYRCQFLPIGGVSDSGFGRVDGIEGLRVCCLEESVVEDRWWPEKAHHEQLSVQELTSTDADGGLPNLPCLRFNKEGNLLAITTGDNGIKILANGAGLRSLRSVEAMSFEALGTAPEPAATKNLKRGYVASNSKDDPAKGSARFTSQVLIMKHPGQIGASVLDLHTSHSALKIFDLGGSMMHLFYVLPVQQEEDGSCSNLRTSLLRRGLCYSINTITGALL